MNILYRFINDVTDSEVIQWITIQYNTLLQYNQRRYWSCSMYNSINLQNEKWLNLFCAWAGPVLEIEDSVSTLNIHQWSEPLREYAKVYTFHKLLLYLCYESILMLIFTFRIYKTNKKTTLKITSWFDKKKTDF